MFRENLLKLGRIGKMKRIEKSFDVFFPFLFRLEYNLNENSDQCVM